VIEGVFQLNVPPALLGYTFKRGGDNEDSAPSTPLLSVYIVLKPSLMVPKTFQETVNTGEDDALVRYSQKWSKEIVSLNMLHTRGIKCIVSTTSGLSVFLPRFVHPLSAPPGVLSSGGQKVLEGPSGVCSGEADLRSMMRFVSLVPAAPEWVRFRRRQDVWPTCREMMDVCTGDHEEHALLLCNFFLGVGVDAYMVPDPALHTYVHTYVHIYIHACIHTYKHGTRLTPLSGYHSDSVFFLPSYAEYYGQRVLLLCNIFLVH
jgi:coiled-coil and C2 domain-containing protein 2A